MKEDTYRTKVFLLESVYVQGTNGSKCVYISENGNYYCSWGLNANNVGDVIDHDYAVYSKDDGILCLSHALDYLYK